MRKATTVSCALFVLTAIVMMAGCGGQGSGGRQSGSESPESVAQAFWKATMTGDVDTSWDLLSEEVQSGLKSKEAWGKSGVSNTLGDSRIKVGKAKITGDRAEVTIKIMKGDELIYDSDVLLVEEDGRWKVQLP